MMHHPFLILTLLVFSLAACAPNDAISSNGADFPSKNLSMICPWSAGGGTDRVARFFADQLEKALGKPAVVNNRTGGGGAVGHSAGAHAKPDGHTITMGTFELSTMHWMGISNLSYADYEPVMQVNSDPAALIVHSDSPYTDVSALVAAIRADPGKLKMSGTATGGAWDLARAGFQMAANLKVSDVLWVPTEGSAPSLVELLGGHIDVVCCSLPEAASQIESGQLKALAVMSGERLEGFPSVPTLKEAGIAWEAEGWRGLLLPKGTPGPVLEKIRNALSQAVQSDAYLKFMKSNRFGVEVKTGEEFVEFLKAQDAQWEKVIRAAGYSRS